MCATCCVWITQKTWLKSTNIQKKDYTEHLREGRPKVAPTESFNNQIIYDWSNLDQSKYKESLWNEKKGDI